MKPLFSLLSLYLLLTACSPTVKIETPTEPIVINLNVKIEHEIRVRLEKGVDELISRDKDLF
ncbi:MAG: YnbE family lipoprotein [Magnetococcales bacterium]|nr:YnbE family lipoprotein [Magnetococcales bacterium]